MRSEQAPLKVECFAFNENGTMDRIGYILLSIRSAQEISKDKELNIKLTWHKLFGCKSDIKVNNPELLLSLIIKDTDVISWKSVSSSENHSEINSHRNPGGDFENNQYDGKNYVSYTNRTQKESLSCKVLQDQTTDISFWQSADALLAANTDKEFFNNVDAQHCYCLKLRLDTIELSLSGSTIQNIEFRFHHPKINIVSIIHPKISTLSDKKSKLQDVECNLYFISLVDEIQHQLRSSPPKISIHKNGENSQILLSQFVLDINRLFCRNNLKCQYKAQLFDMDKNRIGALEVTILLEDNGPYFKMKKAVPDQSMCLPMYNNTIKQKATEEFETWNENEKKIFTTELILTAEQRKMYEEQLHSLKLENERLQQVVNRQDRELKIYRKDSLTPDQTTSLLQELKGLEEKLCITQESKLFFKEQWGKAAREIHRMKMEHQQAVEVQIKNSIEELKNLE